MKDIWKKKGLLYQVEDYKHTEISTHASIPFAYNLKGDKYRIFFSSRNELGKSLPYYIDALIIKDKIELIDSPIGPIFNFGKLGTFDDSGIMPSCVVKNDDKLYMYYIGWNPQVTVSYRLSIGLAISYDNGDTFSKYSDAPICDRDLNEPYFNTAPYVIKENYIWKMWYISCTKWMIIDNHPEPLYHIKYCESLDGIHWKKEGKVCLDYDERAEALGRPSVLKVDEKYKMFFSFRKIKDYRNSAQAGYQVGLAESNDGVNWIKKYNDIGISTSKSGWDSNMMEYCHVFKHKDNFFMLYNGNDFGKKGFGYAVK